MDDHLAQRSARVVLTHCPRCGYSLTGLPESWRCPECGFAYDDRTFVLSGISRGTSGMTRTRKWLWIAVALGGWFGPGLLGGLFMGGSAVLVVTALAVSWVALLVYLVMSGKRERRGIEQLLFAAGGFGYCADLHSANVGENRLIPWREANAVQIDRKGSQWHRLRIGLSRIPGGKLYRTMLDLGVRCDAETAAWLQRVLTERIRAAGSMKDPRSVAVREPGLTSPPGLESADYTPRLRTPGSDRK